MATAPTASRPLLSRHFTTPGIDPYDTVSWETRAARITNERGETIFALEDAEIPSEWTQLATDIVVSKYFRKAGVPGTGHETSVRQVIYRIAHTLREAGETLGGYFVSADEADSFEEELTALLVTQRAAFNSPVWFNCGLFHVYGIEGGRGNWYWNEETDTIEQLDNNYRRPQCSACFIQSVQDDLLSMFDLMKAEVSLFKYGSGTGSNFSTIRGRGEKISAGGNSSGLLSFLKVFDAAAGSIKSGGTTRRAAKMVCVDMDHPEIADFITWKLKEERKVAALVAAGYSADFNGEAYQTVTAQNANNSVRVTDAFLEAVEADGEWNTINRTDGKVAGTYRARELWDMVCQSAWACADPGVQYDTTINSWHTCPNTDKIHASNPCSEFMFLDDSSCNLASINLIKFLTDDGSFDIDAYRQAIRILITAQEILVDFSSYPTEAVARNSHAYRPLGLGYANLGTLLMRKGIPYDSEEAFAITGALTAILTGHAYTVSAEIADRKGPFEGYAKNRQPMLQVIRRHREAAYDLDATLCPDRLRSAALDAWDLALSKGEEYGYRNAQVTVIAPTGTIGLLMDCDTTSIEPDFALVKYKKLAGGGHFKIVNQSVPAALRALDYTEREITEIIRYISGSATIEGAPYLHSAALRERGISEDDLDRIEQQLPSAFDLRHIFNRYNLSDASLAAAGVHPEAFADPGFDFLTAIGFREEEIEAANTYACGWMTIEGAPHLREEHLPIFDCANRCGRYGTRFIQPTGHLRIMAAAQPFLSGAISKTVNLPNEATVEEIDAIYREGWRLGLKAVALYRDGCKLSQPLNSKGDRKATKEEKAPEATQATSEPTADLTSLIPPQVIVQTERRRLPDERQALTHKFRIAGHKGYITVGLYEDGQPGEIFITMAKQGSVISGMMDAFATSISIALQYNVPLEVLVNKFSHVRFEPSGMTNNPNIRIAKSIVDYIFRWMGMKFLDREALGQIGYNSLPKFDDLSNGHGEEYGSAPLAVDSIKESSEESAPKLRVKVEGDGGADTPVPVTREIALKASGMSRPGGDGPAGSGKAHSASTKQFRFDVSSDAPSCSNCGGMMIRNGSCYLCRDCGTTTGCS